MKEGRVERTRAEQTEGRADGTFEEINIEKKRKQIGSRSEADEQSRAGRAGRAEAEQEEQKHRYIYFPLEIISIVDYRPIKI